jgi:hypothetical protein
MLNRKFWIVEVMLAPQGVSKLKKSCLNPHWHEGWYFDLLVLFGSDFVSWIFIKSSQTFLDVKIDINRVNLTPCQAHWSFYCIHCSCQWSLKPQKFLIVLSNLCRHVGETSKIKVRCGEWDTESVSERYEHQERAARNISIHPGF